MPAENIVEGQAPRTITPALGKIDLEGSDRRDICRGAAVTYTKVGGYRREASSALAFAKYWVRSDRRWDEVEAAFARDVAVQL